MNNIKTARNILETMLNASDEYPSEYSLYELKAYIEDIADKLGTDLDFYFETDCAEFRLISEDVIDEIWTESLIEQIKDCYDLSEVPNFVSIDWEQTAENCKVDGMGHHFATYDGEEHEASGYYIFRTN